MTFCVECGAEGPTRDGLCARCFDERRRLIGLPGALAVDRCVDCGSFKVGKSWEPVDLSEALRVRADANLETERGVELLDVTAEASGEGVSARALITAKVRAAPFVLTRRLAVPLKVLDGLCPTDSRRRRAYYEAIVQVRADGRRLDEEETDAAEAHLRRSLARTRADLGVTRTERTEGGVDLYVGDGQAAKAAAAELSKRFGGTSGSSSQLFGRRGGRDVYRVTYLVRLPRLRAGDVVRWRESVYQLQDAEGKRVVDLATGKAARLSAGNLARAKRIAATEVRARIVRADDFRKMVELSDGRTVPLRTARRVHVGARVRILVVGDEAYLPLGPEA